MGLIIESGLNPEPLTLSPVFVCVCVWFVGYEWNSALLRRPRVWLKLCEWRKAECEVQADGLCQVGVGGGERWPPHREFSVRWGGCDERQLHLPRDPDGSGGLGPTGKQGLGTGSCEAGVRFCSESWQPHPS